MRSGEGTSRYDGLTEREREILVLIAEGHTNSQIADRLFISVKTVQTHRAHIMEKLDLHDRSLLVRYAVRKGLIQP
jgi:two-component system response regulator NreC